MSQLLSCQDLTKSFGTQTLFTGVSLGLHSGDRIGLIGPNGSGKSTLLKILCGLESPDRGRIIVKKHVRVSYLPQSDVFAEDRSVADNLYATLKDLDLDETEQYNRVHTLLSRGEFRDTDQPARLLSGGWRKRLAICRALVTHPDILVMDEPTNHLDIHGILWLEKMLQARLPESPAAWIMVSHDRRFLENTVNQVIELSAVYPGGSFQVDGRYSDFVLKRETFLVQQQAREERLANKVRRETEWLRRNPKARSTKARYRIDEAHRLQKELGRVRSRNRTTDSVEIAFDATGRKTKKLLVARKISKRYGDSLLFKDLDLTLSPGTRIGLLGPNGCGKSTLMQLLAAAGSDGEPRPDSGEIRVADGVQIVSFDQKREQLDQTLTLKRALAPDGDSVIYQGRSLHVVSWAKKFLFNTDQLETPVSRLSGGEQARILIANLMRTPADILLLDEPTNDLDIPSLDVLEESLAEFAGAVVLVTHDRFFLERLCDRLLGFDTRDGSVGWFADCDQWLRHLGDEEKRRNGIGLTGTNADREKKAAKKKPGRLSYMDQREHDQMEEKIMTAEAEQEKLRLQMNDPDTASSPDLAAECWEKLQRIEEEINRLYARWEELEEKKQG